MNGLSAITVLVVLDSIYKDQNNATINTFEDPTSFDERFTTTFNNSLVDDQGRNNLSVSSIDKKYYDDESLLPPSPPPTNEASFAEKYDHQDDIGNTSNDSLSSNDSKAPPKECFLRARTGFRLQRQIVVMTVNAASLYDCEHICTNERKFMCNIFSYRYSTVPASDNCMLGEKTIRQMDFYFDLVPDRNYDVYVRNEFAQPGCQPKKNWDTDCFERIRSGLRLDPSLVRFSVNTDTLVDCELICLYIKHFTCRAFSFRYGISSTEYNCLLTDIPVPEMNPRRHFIEDSGCELYHRGSYGHGCEIDRWPHSINPASYPNFTPATRKDWPSVSSPPPTTLKPTIVIVTTTVYTNDRPGPAVPTPPPYDPKHPSYDPRHPSYNPRYPSYDPTPPSYDPTHPSYDPKHPSYDPKYPSYDPKYPSYDPKHPSYDPKHPSYDPTHPSYDPTHPFFKPKGRPYLPPFEPRFRPHKPILPPKDTPTITPWHGGEHNITYHSRKLDKICYVAYGAPARLKANSIVDTVLVVDEQECKAECSRARETGKFRCSTFSYWSGRCELGDVELRDLKLNYDFAKDENYWLFSWDFTNPHCYKPDITPPTDEVWSAYTVSGRRCKSGGKCSHKSDIGIWSCPVEDGDWDYCCRPDHRCGHSEGYSYPWCYVGSVSREQWRPCNEVYFPYKERKRDAPHWPISYVHKRGPPIDAASHQFKPSSVDSSLESVRSDSESVAVDDATEPRIFHSYNNDNNSNSSLLEFHAVNVTETIFGGLNESLAAQSGNVTLNDRSNSLTIISTIENDKLKRNVEGQMPNTS